MSFEKVEVFDPVYYNTPEKVMREIYDLWADRELGNDYYYYSFNLVDDEDEYDDAYRWPELAGFLRANTHEDLVLIHYWW